jgi:hypothetical protein
MLRAVRYLGVLIGAVALAATACGQPQTTNSADAARVVDQFIAAREARDLDATMASFAAAPELRSSQGINWSGRDAVRAIMAYRLQDTYTVGDRHVSGNTVTWAEHVRRTVAAGSPPANFDEDVEATVVDGHIQSLVTYLGTRRAPAAPAAVGEPITPAVPWVLPVSVGLVVFAALIWPTSRSSVPPRQSSGRLLVGLRRYAESHGTQSPEERN